MLSALARRDELGDHFQTGCQSTYWQSRSEVVTPANAGREEVVVDERHAL